MIGGESAKIALRDQVLTSRKRRHSLVERHDLAVRIAEHLMAAPEIQRAATVAAYVALPPEPGTAMLMRWLTDAGKRVILPILLPDNDLDWAVFTSGDGLVPAGRGLLEPDGPRLGVDAIATPDVVIVPGLAVSPTGDRLGRGGGSYDRALGRVPVGTPTWVLLYDDEVGLDVPVEPHDRRVTAAVTPSGIRRF